MSEKDVLKLAVAKTRWSRQERIQALRRAFDATIREREFVADAKKQRFNVVAVTGEELTTIIERIYQTPAEVVCFTAAALGRGR
jgi:tripartite-type tricarboxylate transporter receptor subunit TctC